jgi:ABC-type nitrate/sulfonate/bicarbonate transport system substrate-binding protein
VLVGIEQGFFRQQGLDLDITYTNSITDSMNVLVSGSADLTGGGPIHWCLSSSGAHPWSPWPVWTT